MPKRVLLIDDNEDSVASLGQLLRMFGHIIEVAFDGAAGIEKALRFRPEIVLCDIGLPGRLDGLDVARELRAGKGAGSATLVAITGYGSERDAVRSREAGFDLHLVKPVDGIALAQAIEADFSTVHGLRELPSSS